MNLLACPDSAPNLLGIFDTTIAPTLLFYSYIPIIFCSLLFGLFIYRQNGYSLQGKLVLGIAASFSLWILNILIQWIATPIALVHLSWQLSAIFEMVFFSCAIYFAFVFVREKDISLLSKVLLALPIIIVCLLLPTTLNVVMFDLINCESILGDLWKAIYTFEIVAAAGIAIYGIKEWHAAGVRSDKGKRILFTLLGVSALLAVFALSEIFGEVTRTYEINLVGPLGMVLFLLLLGYTIVKFQAFHIKLVGAQALVFGMLALIASEFFFITSVTSRVLVAATLIATTIGGYFLIRSVKQEIAARERNEELAKDLAKVNARLRELDRQKSEFVSIASHQLRSPLTAIRGYASMLLEGSFGVLPEKAFEIAGRIQESAAYMALSIEDFLNVSRIEQGRMKYELTDTDMHDIVEKVVVELQQSATKRGLALTFEPHETGSLIAHVDPGKTRQIIYNLVDNSLKYTQKGSITVSTNKDEMAKKIIIAIKDTGVGMSPETLHSIFDKFVRAKNANNINVSGTGLGLYVAKQMAEAMGGTITPSSEGEGKGSTFTVTLPLAS